VQVRIPIIGCDHELPAQPPGSDAQEYFWLAGLRIRSAHIGHLKRILELAKFEDSRQTLTGSHLAVESQVDLQRLGVGVGKPRCRHFSIILKPRGRV